MLNPLIPVTSLAIYGLILAHFVLPVRLHPLPDGHVYRDVQVEVNEEEIKVEVGVKASDITWIQLIAKADKELQDFRANPKPTDQAESLAQLQKKIERDTYLPLPETEEQVSQWLTVESNRQILEWWLAKHIVVELGEQSLPLRAKMKSRQNSRHHWAILVETEFDVRRSKPAEELKVQLDAFEKYPGQVRRALKARGDVFLENSVHATTVVRADFEELSEESTVPQRRELIEAQLRFF